MEEVWKPVVGYEGLYEVSNLGRINTINRTVFSGKSYGVTRKFGGIRKNIERKTGGYIVISLQKDKKSSNHLVHRLVAQAFLPNPDNLPQVNHKDENKQNNFVFVNPDGTVDPEKSNLEWCSAAYNNKYGTHPERCGGHNKKPINMLSLDGKFLKRFSSALEAGFYLRGKPLTNISSCANGRRKSAYGYRWEWA